MDAGKFGVRGHLRGGQINPVGSRIDDLEKIRDHGRHDAHRNVFPDHLRGAGRVGKLSSEDDSSGTTRKVKTTITISLGFNQRDRNNCIRGVKRLLDRCNTFCFIQYCSLFFFFFF